MRARRPAGGRPAVASRPPRGLVLALATAFALSVPVAALAHVTIAPSYVEANTTSTITFETPNERPPHATISLTIEAPPGVALSRVAPPHGWTLDLTTTRARWSGGRISGTSTIGFPVRVLARTQAGDQTFRAVQGYDDGQSVRWPATLSVLPASGAHAASHHWGRAFAAGVAVLVILAGSVLVLWRLRRRPLQER
jgi:hypothetical protein